MTALHAIGLLLSGALLGAVAWHNFLLVWYAYRFPPRGGKTGTTPGRGAHDPGCSRDPSAANPFRSLRLHDLLRLY